MKFSYGHWHSLEPRLVEARVLLVGKDAPPSILEQFDEWFAAALHRHGFNQDSIGRITRASGIKS